MTLRYAYLSRDRLREAGTVLEIPGTIWPMGGAIVVDSTARRWQVRQTPG